jgi:hypothetical protein
LRGSERSEQSVLETGMWSLRWFGGGGGGTGDRGGGVNEGKDSHREEV